jgi:ABC-2 type transport system permease protein
VNVILLVATREFTERVRSRAFLVSNAAILLLLLLSLAIPQLIHDDEPTRIGHLGGDAAAVAQLAAAQQSTFDLELDLVAFDGRSDAEAALEDEQVEAVIVDATTVLAAGNLGPQLEASLTNASNAYVIDAALADAGLDAAARASLFAVEALTVERFAAAEGLVDAFDPAVGVVFAAVFLLYGLLAVYGQWVAQGIVEEKQSRVVEVLLATVRPTELLAGKILGLGALGLAQILLLAGIGAGGLLLTDVISVPGAAWGALALVIPWFVLGFLLYATLFAVTGSLVSRVEDMQAAVMPVIVVLVLALFGAQLAVAEPTGTLATVAGVLPFTAPMVQPILFAMGASSAVEVVTAIVLAMGSIAVAVPLAARIYRGGVLRTRGRVSFREAWGSAGREVRRPLPPSGSVRPSR